MKGPAVGDDERKAPPGWYPYRDLAGRRWWDGTQWTSETLDKASPKQWVQRLTVAQWSAILAGVLVLVAVFFMAELTKSSAPITSASTGTGTAANAPQGNNPEAISTNLHCGTITVQPDGNTLIPPKSADLFTSAVECGGGVGGFTATQQPMTFVATFAHPGEEAEWVKEEVTLFSGNAAGWIPEVVSGNGWVIWTHNPAVAARAIDAGGTSQN